MDDGKSTICSVLRGMINFRNFARNTQPVFYRLYEGQEEIVDEYGNATGSYYPVYGPLKCAMLTVSPNVGTAETDLFGTVTAYDRTMTTADTSLEIDEDDVLWLDGADTDGPWNYIVKAVGRWKNSVSYAISKVDVSYYSEIQKQIADGVKLQKEMRQRAANKEEPQDAEDNAEPV